MSDRDVASGPRVPRLRERVQHAAAGLTTTFDGVLFGGLWLFLGALALEVAFDAWRQSEGGVGTLGDWTPLSGLVLALAPAVGARRHATRDALVHRLALAVTGLTVAALTAALLGDGEGLARTSHEGTPGISTALVLGSAAGFSTLLLWIPVRQPVRVLCRALAAASALACAASLALGLAALPSLARRPTAASWLRALPVAATLPSAETWPAREGGLVYHADCERWYCAVCIDPEGSSRCLSQELTTRTHTGLTRDVAATVRRDAATGLRFVHVANGELTTRADGRAATMRDLAGRVAPPRPWVHCALVGALAGMVLSARARRRRARVLAGTWVAATVGADGCLTSGGDAVLVDAPSMPARGEVLAKVTRVTRGGVRVATDWVPGGRAALEEALAVYVAECDAAALAAAVCGAGSLAAWMALLGRGW